MPDDKGCTSLSIPRSATWGQRTIGTTLLVRSTGTGCSGRRYGWGTKRGRLARKSTAYTPLWRVRIGRSDRWCYPFRPENDGGTSFEVGRGCVVPPKRRSKRAKRSDAVGLAKSLVVRYNYRCRATCLSRHLEPLSRTGQYQRAWSCAHCKWFSRDVK